MGQHRLLPAGPEVAIGLQGKRDAGVSEPHRNQPRVRPAGDQQRGMGMPEVMNGEVRYAGPSPPAVKTPGHIAMPEGRAEPRLPDQAVVPVRRPTGGGVGDRETAFHSRCAGDQRKSVCRRVTIIICRSTWWTTAGPSFPSGQGSFTGASAATCVRSPYGSGFPMACMFVFDAEINHAMMTKTMKKAKIPATIAAYLIIHHRTWRKARPKSPSRFHRQFGGRSIGGCWRLASSRFRR